MAQPNRCFNCGSDNQIIKIDPSPGTAFMLSVVDKSKEPPAVMPASGYSVSLFGCNSCGNIMSFVAN